MNARFSYLISTIVAILVILPIKLHALTISQLSQGLLVPAVIQDGKGVDTLIGITAIGNQTATTTTTTSTTQTNVTVYWGFFDKDGNMLVNKYFKIPLGGFYRFAWSNESAGENLANTEGYLVFVVGDDKGAIIKTAALSGSAFRIDATARDAAFVPVVPLTSGDINSSTNLAKMDNTVLKGVTNITPVGKTLMMRYWNDSAVGGSSVIKLWSLCDLTGGYTMSISNNEDGTSQNTGIIIQRKNLNSINPGLDSGSGSDTIYPMPFNYKSGFFYFKVPAGNCAKGQTNAMMAISFLSSSQLGAIQTIIADQY
ncbi:MAG: hypothetical protein ACP5J5_06935 [Dissulfurimicrobium sp.]|uniref:hypothetical protein n=1 Tax=Dissulfurimicrobium TaxID=1769732 RepID=UPI001EDB6512|nr:hypothetical protein [Dissulfurimicrobium hydrothermale]UKL13731.1 hypothetical protein LGS26_00130 [Dissulfurimicrobium hydrothermale]